MFLDDKNQNDIINELVKSYEINYIFRTNPLIELLIKKVEKSIITKLKEKLKKSRIAN